MIHVANRSKFKISASQLTEAAEAALEAEKASKHDLSIAVVTDAEIHLLNRQYLKHDYPTDVISFPLHEREDPDPLLGEVIVSADRARHEARARGLPFEEELCRYVVHGTLHLLGYDDRDSTKREEMHARQEQILRSLLRKKKAAAGAQAAPKPAAKPAAGAKTTAAAKGRAKPAAKPATKAKAKPKPKLKARDVKTKR